MIITLAFGGSDLQKPHANSEHSDESLTPSFSIPTGRSSSLIIGGLAFTQQTKINVYWQDNPAPMLDAAFLGEVLGNDLRRWGEFEGTGPPYGGRTRGSGGCC